jgi:hypothetical protein
MRTIPDRSCVILALLGSLCLAGCGGESPAGSEPTASVASPLVVEPGSLWSTPTSDICFRQGGGAITSGFSGKCVRLLSDAQTVVLYSCDGSPSQSWSAELDGTLRMNGKCMQPVGGGTANGTRVELAPCNGSTAQRWEHTEGMTRLVNTPSRRCLTASSQADNTRLEIRDCSFTQAADHQRFTSPIGWTPTAITSASAGTCATIADANTANGTHVRLVGCDGSGAQAWIYRGVYKQFMSMNKCLQAGSDNTVQIWDCSASSAQKWTRNSSGNLVVASSGLCLNIPDPNYAADPLQLRVGQCDGPSVSGQSWTLPYAEIGPQQRRQLRDAITNTWVAATQMNLVDWQTCPNDYATLSSLTNLTVIEARIQDGRYARGDSIDGFSFRALQHNLWGGVPDPSAPDFLGFNDWNRGGAVHELGHLLGFPHEQQRKDNEQGDYCDVLEHWSPTQWDYGPYDPYGIMNYCGTPQPVTETTDGFGNLSFNDVAGVRSAIGPGMREPAYGTREFRRLLWTSGSAQQTDFHKSPGPMILFRGQAWSSVDGRLELRLSTEGHLGVYGTNLYVHNDPAKGPLKPLWEAKDANGTVVTGVQASFQPDGRLHLADEHGFVWDSPDPFGLGETLSIQQDGNVVISDAGGGIVWSTETAYRDSLQGAVGLAPNATLVAGDPAHESKTTKSGRFTIIMQTDGNLVIYDRGAFRNEYRPIWASNTWLSAARVAKMRLDGTLALLDTAGNVIWTAPYAGRPATFVALQEDGNLVAYEPSKYEVWAGGVGGGANGVVGAFQPTFDAPPVRLWRDSRISAGQTIWSETGRSYLAMQLNGQLAFYVDGALRWSSGTAYSGASVGLLSYVGELQVTSAGGAVLYRSNTDQYLNTYLTFTDEGRLSIYRVVTDQADGIGFVY